MYIDGLGKKDPRERRRDEAYNRLHQSIYNTSRWKKLRDWKRQQSPLCEKCQQKGTDRIAEHIHHIEPFAHLLRTDLQRARELAYDPGNLQALCRQCHQEAHGSNYEGLFDDIT